MHHWIDDLTPLRVLPKTLDAAQYNRVRVGILRLGTPLYLSLAEFPGLTCALDSRVWIVFDEIGAGLPILAWLNFQRAQSNVLHMPVSCELRLYHAHAGLIMGRAVDAIETAVDARRHAQPAIDVVGVTAHPER